MGEGDPLGDTLGVPLAGRDGLAVFDPVRVAVDVAVEVTLMDREGGGVPSGVGLAVGDVDAPNDADDEGDGGDDPLAVPVLLLLKLIVGEGEGDALVKDGTLTTTTWDT